MYDSKPLSNNRVFIYHLLKRMLRFNCPMSGTFHFDVTDLYNKINDLKKEGYSIGLVSCLVKATSLSIEKFPRMNNRIFHTLLGKKEVSYDSINCGVAATRIDPLGEEVIIPIILRGSNKLSIQEIHNQIKENKTLPVEKLESYEWLQKSRRLPRFLIPFVHYLFRSNPKFSAKNSSTYAISSIMEKDSSLVSSHSPANQTTFFPISLKDQAMVHNGEVKPRKVLAVTFCVDHFLVDGMDVQRCGNYLKNFLENPKNLLKEFNLEKTS